MPMNSDEVSNYLLYPSSIIVQPRHVRNFAASVLIRLWEYEGHFSAVPQEVIKASAATANNKVKAFFMLLELN